MIASVLLAALAALPFTSAHVGLWDNSGFYQSNDGYTAAYPLANKGTDFWFHGASIPSNPAAHPAKKLQAGGSVTLELSCQKQFTSMGGRANGQACPDGIEAWKSLHIPQPPAKPVYLGCGLAIAYKPLQSLKTFADIKTSDFTVFSVKNECVKDLKTDFAIPKDMPACPEGGCVCAWFWQGQDSANEMYMTGFKCDVEGGIQGATPGTPQPAKLGGGVTGPKQPLIWANNDPNHPNNANPSSGSKPGYTPAWGFADGAQPMGAGSGSGSVSSSPSTPSTGGNESTGGTPIVANPGTPAKSSVAAAPSAAPIFSGGSGSGSGSGEDEEAEQEDDEEEETPKSTPSAGGRGRGRGGKWRANRYHGNHRSMHRHRRSTEGGI